LRSSVLERKPKKLDRKFFEESFEAVRYILMVMC